MWIEKAKNECKSHVWGGTAGQQWLAKIKKGLIVDE
jgi:hypothetical protein